jgi:hypothetical protein
MVDALPVWKQAKEELSRRLATKSFERKAGVAELAPRTLPTHGLSRRHRLAVVEQARGGVGEVMNTASAATRLTRRG